MLKLYFTKNQLIKNYFNITSTKNSLDRNNSYYLIGLYKNIAFTNVVIQIFKIKSNLFLMTNYVIKNNYLSGLLVNTIQNKNFIKAYKKFCLKLKLNYFLGIWWNGLLTNFKSFIKHKRRNRGNVKFFFFKKKYPNVCIYINYEDITIIDVKSKNFYKETNKNSLLTLHFLNSTNSNFKSSSSVLNNTASVTNNIFITEFSFSIMKKFKLLYKKKFIFYVLRKWKNSSKSKTNRFLFFEYHFNKKISNKFCVGY